MSGLTKKEIKATFDAIDAGKVTAAGADLSWDQLGPMGNLI